MANVKISELPLGTPNSTSIFPFVDEGTTYQGAISAITSNGGGVTEVTYSELYDFVTGETLNAGSYYIITDFKTCYDQPDYDYNKNALFVDNYKEGPIEPIIVFATSANTLSTTAYQPAYPNDRIQYDVYFNETEATNGAAYGRITERIDEFNNRTDYDHRTILFKRYRYYEINFSNPYQGTVQVSSVSETEMVVSGTGTNFLSIGGTGSNVGFDTTSNDYKVYEITNIISDTEMTITGLTNINLSSGTKMFPADWDEYCSYYQNNVDDSTTLFEEYYTFDFENNPSGNKNNYIGNHANLFQSNENDFILANNVFYSTFRGNKFGNSCYNNTFFDDCDNNTVGNYFYNNITDDDFDGNIIGNYFYNNRTTSNFQYNRIGENFYNNYIVQNSFYRNNIGNDFRDNQISGDDFQNNEIGNQFHSNVLRNGQFYKNDIKNGFNNNIIYWNFYGNVIGNGYDENEIYCPFYDNIIGDYYNNNNLGDINSPSSNQFYENRIGYNFYNNSITADTNNNIIGNDFENNTILSDFLYNQIFDSFKGNLITENGNFEFNTVGFGFSANQLSGYCGGNIFGSVTIDNDFYGDVVSNTIDNWVSNNIIGDEFVNNKIGNYFQNNNIGIEFQNNVIGSNFQDNTINDGFGFGAGNYQGNKIGNNFSENTIGEYFYNNTVPDNFYNNTIGNYFQWNIVNTWINGIDFTYYYGNVTAFTYTALGTNAVDGIYTGLSGVTNGNGIDATFDVEVSGDAVIGVSGNTEGKLYVCGNTITISGVLIGGYNNAIDTYSDNIVAQTGTTGTYNGISATGGTGVNATFDVEVDGFGVISTLNKNNFGIGYTNGDSLVIVGSLFGGTDVVDDITITITGLITDNIQISVGVVPPAPSVYEGYTCNIFKNSGNIDRLSYYDENDILTIKNINE